MYRASLKSMYSVVSRQNTFENKVQKIGVTVSGYRRAAAFLTNQKQEGSVGRVSTAGFKANGKFVCRLNPAQHVAKSSWAGFNSVQEAFLKLNARATNI